MAEHPATLIAPERDAPNFSGRLAAVAALFILLGATLLQVYRVGADGDGIKSFAYSQDAAYEQLVISRELAQGVETGPAQYRGATPLIGSASPGWSLAMAFLLGLPSLSPDSGRGVDEIALVPLVVNVVAAALLVMVAGHLVRLEIHGVAGMLAFLLAVGVLIPLPLLVLNGMQHLIQTVVILLAVAVGLRSIEDEDVPVGLTLLAGILLAISVALGYQALAVIFALMVWAWIQRRAGRAVFLAVAGMGVVLAVGKYLTAHGGSVVPNPVLMHAGTLIEGGWSDWPSSVLRNATTNLQATTLPWVLLGMGVVLLAGRRGQTHSFDPLERGRAGWLFVFVFAGLAHLLLGPADATAPHHTAYLVALGAVAIGRAVGATYNADRFCVARSAALGVGRDERTAVLSGSVRPWCRGGVLVAAVCVLPLMIMAMPAIRGFVTAPQAARDAYARNRLAASFVRTYFPSGPVATNETGLLGYETHARLVDLSGRTNRQLALARFKGSYDSNRVAAEVAEAGGPVAILFASGPPVPVPQAFKQIGGWYPAGTGRNSDSAVAVYSVSPVLETDVRIALRLFSEQRVDGIDFWFDDEGRAG
jgi:hypothetical protein